MAGTESISYALTVSNSGNIDYSYSEDKTLTQQDVTLLSKIVVENDSEWNSLPVGGSDYVTFLLIETDAPVSLVINSTANDVIPVETTAHLTFGVSGVTAAWLKNSGSNIARVSYIVGGKLSS